MSIVEKAVIDLNGEWPESRADDGLIVSTENNICHGAGKYDFYSIKKDVRTDDGAAVWNYLCDREEFNATTDRMRGKPDWKDVLAKHPKANWLAQWPGIGGIDAGLWISYEEIPDLKSEGYVANYYFKVKHHNKGTIIGDWRKTLEQRPEHIADANEKTDPLNGYKWGVEYQTNGKRPDLADDVYVQIKHDGIIDWLSAEAVDFWAWTNHLSGEKFRITDQRYKPADTSYLDKPAVIGVDMTSGKDESVEHVAVQDDSDWWDCQNDKMLRLPPPGEEVEAAFPHEIDGESHVIWVVGRVIAHHEVSGKFYSWISQDGGFYPPNALQFRPLDHATRKAEAEKKRLIEQAKSVCFAPNSQSTLTTIESLIAAGWRPSK